MSAMQMSAASLREPATWDALDVIALTHGKAAVWTVDNVTRLIAI